MSAATTLHCFVDSIPDGLVSGFRVLAGLPRGAQQHLWPLIEAELAEVGSASERRQVVEGYAHRFEANPAHVWAATRACSVLLRHAAARKLPANEFVEDLAILLGSSLDAAEILVSRYERVREDLRLRLLEDTLADHGNVLIGFDWRVDEVRVSNHGEMHGAPVVLLKLRYRHGSEFGHLPLQLTPSAVASLKEFWAQFEAEEPPDDDTRVRGPQTASTL